MFRRTTRVGAVLAALSLLAAACSDDDGVAADDTTTTASAEEAPAGDREPSDDPAIPDETGPADDSLDPIVIGAINMDDGVPSFPGVSIGWDVAADYVNEHLGGIGGHPIEIRHCSVGLDPESNQACAQELANDDAVDVVMSGFVITSAPIYPVLEQAELPISIQTPFGESDFAATIGFAHYPGNPGISSGLPFFAINELGASNITLAVEDNEAGRAAAAGIAQLPVITASGATVTPAFVAQGEADVTGPLLAGGADEADAVVIVAPAPTCIQVANAMDQLAPDTHVLGVSSCGEGAVKEAAGAKVEGWYLANAGPSTSLAEGVDPQVDRIRDIFGELGDVEDLRLTSTATSFGQVLALWSIGNEIGADTLDRATWLDGLRGFTGPVFMGPDAAKCPGVVFPAVCTFQSRFSQIAADGVETAVNDGEPIDPFAAG